MVLLKQRPCQFQLVRHLITEDFIDLNKKKTFYLNYIFLVTGTPPPNPLRPTPPPNVLNNITNQPVNFANIINNLSKN